MTLRDGLDLQTGLMEKLGDLLKQATVERSHFYVGKCVSDAILEIKALQTALEAALALCRAYHTYIHCVPDHDAEEALSYVAHFETDLDTALKPFRKEGLG